MYFISSFIFLVYTSITFVLVMCRKLCKPRKNAVSLSMTGDSEHDPTNYRTGVNYSQSNVIKQPSRTTSGPRATSGPPLVVTWSGAFERKEAGRTHSADATAVIQSAHCPRFHGSYTHCIMKWMRYKMLYIFVQCNTLHVTEYKITCGVCLWCVRTGFWGRISWKRLEIETWLQWTTNRK